MDSIKIEEMGPLMPNHTTRYREKKIVKEYFEAYFCHRTSSIVKYVVKAKMSKKCNDIIGH